ncbi:MAG: DUF2079 domain-containing protein [Candidatus Andersenbacteria bacterium]|nr:DUF2079 domain-containing protein [Candidatus Andersenbacteria bacterium]MBI3250915.1 DUF2079 domain-containing protein [Candidatus Andersenbacteria bacterium]
MQKEQVQYSFLALFVWLLIAVFSAAYIYIGYLNLTHLRAGVDLGTYTQLLHNVSENRVPPFNTLKEMVAWGDHAHFILAIFAPLFSLWPHPMFVVVLQVIALTTSAWPIFAIARKKLGSAFFALAMTIAYLVFFGVQYALDFDFHANTLTAAALAWTFYAFETKKWRLFWITYVLGLLTREDAAVFYFALAVYIFLAYRKQYRRFSLIIGTLSLIYFFAVTYFIMPHWQASGTPLAYFDVPESTRNPVALAWWIITNPKTILQNMTESDVARRTMRYLFQSFGFLPLASPFTYLLAAPNFLARFLSPEGQRHMMNFHYSVSLVSILAYGAILGTATLTSIPSWISRRTSSPALKKYIIWAAAVVLLVGTLISSWRDIDLPLRQLLSEEAFNHRYGLEVPYAEVLQLRNSISPEDSVVATSGAIPLLAVREEIYLLQEMPVKPVDWVILTLRGNTWPLSQAELVETVRSLRSSPEYELVVGSTYLAVFHHR